ncbi:MAG: isocitrate/isopropylmalate dehydrogenase family protein [Deltaproteobacteria bacterium]|nr:isocitrate/isopropylmalate dehydrogenase family protein [Deltaproteobacteria bacterium]
MSAKFSVIALPGDGIGPEVMAQGLRVLDAISAKHGFHFDVEQIPCGGKYYLEHGTDWPEGSEARCAAADLILLGAVGWPGANGKPVTMKDGKMAGWSPVIGNRTRLDLYANVRPVKLYPGVRHRIHGERKLVWQPGQVDMVIVRENTEGLYSGIGGITPPGPQAEVATDLRVITRRATERVVRYAFELAKKRDGAPKDGKKRLTCIVKDNVLRGCQLFVDIFHKIGADYPEVERDVAIVDAFTQWLIGQPEYYDVCVTSNMFGDIVTDLASVLQGGMGMAVGCNIGDKSAMFEPIHGSAPRHANQDKANPIAMILCVAEGLRWLGERKERRTLSAAGDQIEQAVKALLADGKPLTYDLVGQEQAAKMSDVTAAIIAKL